VKGCQSAACALIGRVWDVAIVGGGPAGAIAALHLARAGHSVIVLERHSFPREKVCGDALIADALRALDRARLLGKITEVAKASTSLRLFSASQLEVRIPSRTLLIKRIHLDEVIAAEAYAAGATVAIGDVAAVEAGPVARLTLRDGTLVKARIAVIATGADTRLIPGAEVRRAPSVLAVRRYFRSTVAIDELVVYFDRTLAPGYAWLFPLPNGEYNIGCGTAYGRNRKNLAASLDRFIQFPPLRPVIEGITAWTPLRGAVLRTGLNGSPPFVHPNVLAIGESIGSTLPLTGEGIGKAMETGELAATVAHLSLTNDDVSILRSYPVRLETLRTQYSGYEIGERWLARPWLTDIVARVVRRSSHARSAVQAVLNDDADPRKIFSVTGMLRMLIH
jgi:geranylgeranyl reductase family protein